MHPHHRRVLHPARGPRHSVLLLSPPPRRPLSELRRRDAPHSVACVERAIPEVQNELVLRVRLARSPAARSAQRADRDRRADSTSPLRSAAAGKQAKPRRPVAAQFEEIVEVAKSGSLEFADDVGERVVAAAIDRPEDDEFPFDPELFWLSGRAARRSWRERYRSPRMHAGQ